MTLIYTRYLSALKKLIAGSKLPLEGGAEQMPVVTTNILAEEDADYNISTNTASDILGRSQSGATTCSSSRGRDNVPREVIRDAGCMKRGVSPFDA